MADNRIKLNSLGVIEEVAPQYVQIGETVVTVERFIPYEKMLDMIQWCIDYIINDRPFISAPLKKIIKDFAILNFYTNFDFNFMTEYHDMSEIYGEYDFVTRFNVIELVKQHIDANQLKFFEETLEETLQSISTYRNSAVGIVDVLAMKAKEDTNIMEQAMGLISDEDKNSQFVKLMKMAESIQDPNK